MTNNLNPGQKKAVATLLTFLTTSSQNERYILLEGYAGTGKTHCLKELLRLYKGRAVLTAPTNKATKVLQSTLTSAEYKPDCCTIFSLLGLQLTDDKELREVIQSNADLDLSRFSLIIVDEASMVNSELLEHIKTAAKKTKAKFLFIGDSYQLPPVKEYGSAVWTMFKDTPALEILQLTEVMRHGGYIQTCLEQIRAAIPKPFGFILDFLNNTSKDNEEVSVLSSINGYALIAKIAAESPDEFLKLNRTKVIAWRNNTVDTLNALIRKIIFPLVTERWAIGDRIVIRSQAKDFIESKVFATVDEEGAVVKVTTGKHPIYDLKVYNVTALMEDNKTKIFVVLHEDSLTDYRIMKADKLQEAKLDRKKWTNFWKFVEYFHDLGYAYAITAHRAQGSSYKQVIVMFGDIMVNRSRQDALKCLYVAASRAQKKLIFVK